MKSKVCHTVGTWIPITQKSYLVTRFPAKMRDDSFRDTLERHSVPAQVNGHVFLLVVNSFLEPTVVRSSVAFLLDDLSLNKEENLLLLCVGGNKTFVKIR